MGSITGLYECPSCNRPLTFRHKETHFIICPNCHTPIQRLEGDVLVTKPVLIVSFKNEIIQPGTKGVWQNRKFEVIGRVRFWFEESVFNYWTVILDDGVVTYLGEGYGLYAIYEKVRLQKVVTVPDFDSMSYDAQSKSLLDGKGFFMERKYKSDKFEIEGEVLMPAAKDTVKIFELSAIDGSHLEIIGFSHDLIVSYKVTYTDFHSLLLSNTRSEKYHVKEFTCSSCQNIMVVKTYPYAQSCSCNKCGTRLDIVNKRNAGRDKNEHPAPYIGIGSKGFISDVEYEVLGYTLKQENNKYKSQWKEFVLHNPAYGYAFLSEYDGNFILVKEKGDTPVLSDCQVKKFTYAGEPFHLYNRYSATILDAWGEFPYNVFNDSAATAYEFISPPEMWILEKSNKEGINWFFGEHVSRKDLPVDFSKELPGKNSIGAIEPKGFVNTQQLVLTAIAAALFIMLVHLAIGFTASEKVILDNSYAIPDSSNPVTIVTNKFELTKWRSNLECNIVAPVNNSWFELSGTLVDARTGAEYSFEQGVEYYAGYEGGESWSEGSRSESVVLSSIPAGTYFLQLQATKEPYKSIDSFQLTVVNDVPMTRNLFIILGLLLLWPLIKFKRVQNSEKSRWYNSPFSPYTYEE